MTIAELLAVLRIKPDKKSFDAADKLIGGVKTALAGLAAYAGVNALKGFVDDTTALGGELADMSIKANASAEELQELGYAATLSGGSLEGVGDILTKVSKNVYEAANGNKSLAESFRKAGIAVKNADGSLRPAADVLGDISDHLKDADEGARAGIAMELAGKSAAAALPWLSAGSEELGKMRDEARELGGVLSNETVAALDDFGDEQDKVKFALTGLRNEAVAALLPTLKEMVHDLLEWVKANKKIIAQKLTTILKVLASGFKIVAKVIGVVVDVIAFLGEHADATAVAVIALAAAMAIFKAASIGAAIASAAAWVLATLPLILMAAAIAAVILIVEDLYMAFTGGNSVIKEGFEMMIAFLKKKFNELIDWVEDRIFGFLRELAESLLGIGISTEHEQKIQEITKRTDETDDQYKARMRQFEADNPDIQQGVTSPRDMFAAAPPASVTIAPKIEMKIDGSKDPEETARVVRAQVDASITDMLRQANAQVGG